MKKVTIIIMLLAFAATTSVATAQRHRSNRQTTKTATKSNPNAADLKLIDRAISGISTAQDSLCEKVFYGKFDKKALTTSNVSAIKSKADAGEAWAQDIIGELYNGGLSGYTKNLPKCVEWYRKSADQGYVWGLVNLACRYDGGEGVSENMYKAFEYFKKAAELGNAEAQYGLGDYYYNGDGVQKDYYEAVKWYRKAAEQGHAEAQCILGDHYYNGEGLPKDYNEAVKWYRKAAEQGDAEAMIGLGLCYENGNGVQENNDEARKLYKKAVNLGNKEAKEYLIRLDAPDYSGYWYAENDMRASRYYFDYDPVKKTLSGTLMMHGAGECDISGVVKGNKIHVKGRYWNRVLTIKGNRLLDRSCGIWYSR